MKVIDLSGMRFGRLTVEARGDSDRHGQARWSCRCDCGGATLARSGDLRSGRTQSCGCFMIDRTIAANSREVVTYVGAHARVRRERGPARGHSCADCGARADDWSYQGGDPDELRERKGKWVVPYSLRTSFYVARCKTCHNRFDHPKKEVMS